MAGIADALCIHDPVDVRLFLADTVPVFEWAQLMPQFVPDQCTFKDPTGMAIWDDNHFREHQQFVQVLAAQTPAILLDNYDFLQMLTAGNAKSSILETHNTAHTQLRQITGVSGTDYSQYNMNDEQDFYNFLGAHALEHSEIRQALGII